MKAVLAEFIGDQLLNGRVRGGVSEDDDLLGSGLVDSLGIMQLVWFIEKEFGMDVPAEDVTIENFQSVAKIEVYLNGRRSEQ
jgi:acyl carrier protein